MIKLDKETKITLIDLFKKKSIGLEGNIIKVIDSSDDEEFAKYLSECSSKDKDSRRKRLDITKKVQIQNTELSGLNEQNKKILEDLQKTLTEAKEQKTQIEQQNAELTIWREENEKIQIELQNEMVKSEQARLEAERAKDNAQNDLDILQKKTQNELISTIVRVALWVIMGVGFLSTGVYLVTLFSGKDTQIISAAWSNIIGILLTNAFSIVGTIMGIKYATEKKD